MRRRINPARPPALGQLPIMVQVCKGDELLFTLHEEHDAQPVATSRLRVTDGPDNFLTFNLTQEVEVMDALPYYLVIRVVKHDKEQTRL